MGDSFADVVKAWWPSSVNDPEAERAETKDKSIVDAIIAICYANIA